MHPHSALILSSRVDAKANGGGEPHVADMEVISAQAVLMQAGGITFNAMKTGDIAGILVGLVALAYHSLLAVSVLRCEVGAYAAEKKFSYQLLDIMRLLSGKINDCSDGEAKDYSALYYVCSHLATNFLNADFGKAFEVYHDGYSGCINENADADNSNPLLLPQLKLPDLTDCLYE
ncbi:MAG: hypothetical protein FJ190_11290 [Gammaproteobacteria bacterium]|nr:hypothetical protein [Gammaproteobacteria bacterium]